MSAKLEAFPVARPTEDPQDKRPRVDACEIEDKVLVDCVRKPIRDGRLP
jgi:hypothetical protein